MSATDKLTGRVKWFDSKKGFGFITNISDDSDEYFVHHSRLNTKESCFKTLYEGEYVIFNVVTEDKKRLADDVLGIGGGSLMCESRRSKHNNQHDGGDGDSDDTVPINN